MVQNNITVSDIRILPISIIFLKNTFAVNPDPDSIVLKVYDSEGTQRGPDYTLTSNPTLSYISSTKTYYIEIDVTNFPDGDIEAHWTAELDGIAFHDLNHESEIVSSYPFESKIPIIRLGDQVLTEPTSRFFVEYDNTVGPYQIKDNTNTPYTPYSVEARVYNPYTQELIATVVLVEVMSDALHSGIYQGSWNPSDLTPRGIYTIQLYAKDKADSSWSNIDDARTISLIDRVESMSVEVPLMASPSDVKAVCGNIEEYINQKSQAYREAVIEDALQMAHDTIMNYVGAKIYTYRNPILRHLEAVFAAYIILRSDVSIDQKLLATYKTDINEMCALIQKNMGSGSERATIFC